MEFNEQERRILSNLGRSENGRDLIFVLNRMKDHYSNIDGIDGSKGDAGAQIEGRKLFKSMVDDLIRRMQIQERPRQPRTVDDYD